VAPRDSINVLENRKIGRFVVLTALILRTCYSIFVVILCMLSSHSIVTPTTAHT